MPLDGGFFVECSDALLIDDLRESVILRNTPLTDAVQHDARVHYSLRNTVPKLAKHDNQSHENTSHTDNTPNLRNSYLEGHRKPSHFGVRSEKKLGDGIMRDVKVKSLTSNDHQKSVENDSTSKDTMRSLQVLGGKFKQRKMDHRLEGPSSKKSSVSKLSRSGRLLDFRVGADLPDFATKSGHSKENLIEPKEIYIERIHHKFEHERAATDHTSKYNLDRVDGLTQAPVPWPSSKLEPLPSAVTQLLAVSATAGRPASAPALKAKALGRISKLKPQLNKNNLKESQSDVDSKFSQEGARESWGVDVGERRGGITDTTVIFLPAYLVLQPLHSDKLRDSVTLNRFQDSEVRINN